MKFAGALLLLVVALAVVMVMRETQAVPSPWPQPQDLGMGMLMVAGQVKDMIETGAAARNEHSVEFLGQRISDGMQIGFGDAVRPVGRRRRRRRSTLN